MVKRLLIVFMTVLLVFAVLPVHVTAQESDWLPAPTGPFQIGTATYHWVDELRDELFTSAPGDKREIIVRFWYPATVEPGATPELYLTNTQAWEFMTSQVAEQDDWIMPPNELITTSTHAYPSAPVSDARDAYPVLVFTHGWAQLSDYYTALLEELASQGYVVAGITHPYASAPVTLQSGVVANFVPDNRMAVETSSADQLFVLDQLEMLNVSDPLGLFVGHLDLNHLGVMGHSLGGVDAILTCVADSRCQAALDLDAYSNWMGDNWFLNLNLEDSTLPILFLVSSSWGQPDFEFFERAGGPAYYLTFEGIAHMNIGDFPLWLKPANKPDMMRTDFDAQRAVEIINAYVLAFFDQYLKGQEASLLASPSSAYPEIQFLSRN